MMCVKMLLGDKMRNTTKLMIEKYALKKLKYDFMGYEFSRTNELSFHHLIVPHKECKALGLMQNGYLMWNGAILVQETSHEYLHIIGNYDYEIFQRISNEMIEENVKGHLDFINLKRIHDLLTYFEIKYQNVTNKKGYPIIKEEYTKRLIKKLQ